MDAVPPFSQVVHIDDQAKQHLVQVAQDVTLATDQQTGIRQVQPVIEQNPLTEETLKDAQDFHSKQEPEEKISKLSYIIPALQKKVRTTKAVNFLDKKMEWLSKKTGNEVHLKEE
jgi:hypothetical protein